VIKEGEEGGGGGAKLNIVKFVVDPIPDFFKDSSGDAWNVTLFFAMFDIINMDIVF